MRSELCRKLLGPAPGSVEKTEHVRNYVKAMCFAGPDWVPCSVSLLPAAWLRHGEALEEVVLDHPRLFPGYQAGGFRNLQLSRQYQEGTWTDAWGTAWRNMEAGMDSIPVESEAPLRDWEALDGLVPPDPRTVDDMGNAMNWDANREALVRARENGGLATGGLPHGFMYMRLFYLRGFANLMMDIASRDPRLDRLVDLVAERNAWIVGAWLDAGAEMISAGDDLGMQTSLPMSPDDWRRYVKPGYWRIFARCCDESVPVYLHSDGHMLEIIPDLIECGITVINPQIRANGLDGLVRWAKGKVCINLDLDRQLFPFAEPHEIRAHIREAFDALYSPEGGLMLAAECAQDVPPGNVRAICETLEELCWGR